jgi:hypothetical protein
MNILSSSEALCLQQNAGNIQYCRPPTLWNPHNVTTLADLRISYLSEVVPYNRTCNDTNGRCYDVACKVASNLLPIDMGLLGPVDMLQKGLQNPANLNVGLLELLEFARRIFPYPTNTSSAGAVVDWWVNATSRDAANVSQFFDRVTQECWYEYCRSRYTSFGNPDIVGLGVSTARQHASR